VSRSELLIQTGVLIGERDGATSECEEQKSKLEKSGIEAADLRTERRRAEPRQQVELEAVKSELEAVAAEPATCIQQRRLAVESNCAAVIHNCISQSYKRQQREAPLDSRPVLSTV